MNRLTAAQPRQRTWGLLALGMVAFALPLGASVLDTPEANDPRWTPWMGCWEPSWGAQSELGDLLLCILPEDGVMTLSTWVDGERVETDALQVEVGPTPVSEAGCEGTRTLSWSDDGRRLFLEGQVRCDFVGNRTSRGLFALTDDGNTWVEIQALGIEDGSDPVLSVRFFHPASAAAIERQGIARAEPADARLIHQARQMASRPLTDAAIVEATERTGGAVAAALVAEMGHPFTLNAQRLRGLRQAGVPAEVVDVMVAVTWPTEFEILADGRVGQAPPPMSTPQAPSTESTRGLRGGYGTPAYRMRYGYGYGLFWDPYLGYSYGAPGYGYGYSPYPWYSGPAYIVVPPRPQTPSSGTMTPSGYRPSGSGGTARPANPPTAGSRPSTPASNPAVTRSSPPATQSAPPSSTQPERRRAVPRTSGGGGGDPQF